MRCSGPWGGTDPRRGGHVDLGFRPCINSGDDGSARWPDLQPPNPWTVRRARPPPSVNFQRRPQPAVFGPAPAWRHTSVTASASTRSMDAGNAPNLSCYHVFTHAI